MVEKFILKCHKKKDTYNDGNSNYAYLASLFKDDYFALLKEINQNKTFKLSVYRWILAKWDIPMFANRLSILKTPKNCNQNLVYIFCNEKTSKFKFDKEILCWSILNAYITKRIQNEYIAAYLSTLGGAYSSLGDYFEKHAKKAGLISRKQYILAIHMNDPVQRLRCQLFYAHSLMQCNQIRKAAKTIRYVYKQCKGSSFDLSLVLTCCKAAWSKYLYLKSTLP